MSNRKRTKGLAMI